MAYGKPVKPRKGKKGVPQKPDERYKKGKEREFRSDGLLGRAEQAIIDRKKRWAQSSDDHQ